MAYVLFSQEFLLWSQFDIDYLSREPQAVIQNPASVRDVREEVCLCDHNEAAFGDPHRGEAFLLQGLRQAVHAKRKP